MEELKQALRQIAGNGPRLKAVIVDDDFDSMGVPSLSEWVALQDALQELPELHDDLLESLDALKHNVDEPPSIETLTKAIKRLRIAPTGNESAAFDIYTRSEHLLQRLTRFLDDLGFEVECFARKPTFKDEQLPFLCLVDYQILPEEESGQTAATLFAHLMSSAEAGQRPPPFVILMSKALSDTDVDKWTALAEKAGFFRFNYGFLNKEQFLNNYAHLSYPLLHFVKHERLSKAYFLQMNSLVAEASGIARKVSRQLFQVTPPEALLFKDRVYEEGSSLSTELSALFSELFSREIRVSSNVVARMNALEQVITEEGIPVPHRQQRSALHRLYAELLHEKCEGADNEPAFGDIFEDSTGTYFLILSQECDLANGEQRVRKTERVLAIEGELRNAPPSKSEGEMFIAKPVFIAGNEQPMWLRWNFGRPVGLPLSHFSSILSGGIVEEPFAPVRPVLSKRWKLRFDDAEDIQHRFATRMTRVALNVMPEFVHVHTFRCGRNDEIIEGAPAVFIYEVQRNKQFALAPESHGSCYSIDDGAFMSKGLIEELSGFISIEKFTQALQRESLLAFVNGEDLLLSKVAGTFKNKRPWKGLG